MVTGFTIMITLLWITPGQAMPQRHGDGFSVGVEQITPHLQQQFPWQYELMPGVVSVEFRQHRQYVPGDEIRRLDWKVFGRSDRFYIREHEEETNVRATILLDVSGSMAYGSGEVTKHHYATRLAACLAYLMLQQADGVGLVSFDTGVREYIPPRSR